MTEPATQPRIVPRYSVQDEVDLLWFHGLGQTSFERSTFGGMLDRASAFANRDAWPKVPVLNDAGAVIGWESGITARPTAETREISGYVPDLAALERYARVSKQMMRVERADAMAATVISIMFGDAGQRWASTEHGRNGCLYRLTVKGTALIDTDAKAPNAIQLTAEERIANICLSNKLQPKQERTTALAVCARQAEDLERRARSVWHMAKLT